MKTICDFIEIINNTLVNDLRIKACQKFHADKSLQIQLYNGEIFNLCITKLDDNAYKIKRKK